MPKKTWTKKDERKYEAILSSCKLDRPRGKKRSVAACKRLAATVVNRDRKVRLSSTSGGTRLPPGHQKLHDSLKAAELFDSLIAYGDSEDDRRAAYALVKQRYPQADFQHLIPGYGLRRRGLDGTSEEHAIDSRRASTRARRDLIAPRSCTAAIEAHAQVVTARAEAWWTSSETRETDNDLTRLVYQAQEAIRRLCGCGNSDG